MFDVYVDGATGTSREAVRELASAMAARYRLPAVDLEARLTRGRFRVKAGVDRATAEAYLRDLAAIGARVRIEPAGEPAAGPPGRSPQAESRPERSSLPPQPGPRATHSSLPPQRHEPRPMRSSSLPQPEEPRLMRSSSPPPGPRATHSSSPPPPGPRVTHSSSPPPGPRATHSSLPPQPESRPMRSSLPPQPESRPARSSLPPQPESRPARSSLPPQPGPRATHSSLPPQPEEPRPMRSSLPPQPEPRSTRSSQSAPAEESSLTLSLLPQAAGWSPAGSSDSPADDGARAATGPIATLGALDRSGTLSLATLDDELAPAPSTDGTLPASMGPAAPRPARPARSRNEPVDPFAPPELAAAEPLLELADDDLAKGGRKRASTPPAMAAEPARPATPSSPPAGPQWALSPQPPGGPVPATHHPREVVVGDDTRGHAHANAQQATASSVRGAEPGLRTPPGPEGGAPQRLAPAPSGAPDGVPQRLAPAPSGSLVPADARPRILDAPPSALGIAARRLGSQLMAWIPVLASARVRLVAGVALAIALGFVPTHLVAGMRERSAFAAIDAKVTAVQSTADTPDSYAALDGFRAEQLDAKYSARRSIAVTSLLVWAAAGAALAYGWFSLFRSASASPAAARPARVSPGGTRGSLGG